MWHQQPMLQEQADLVQLRLTDAVFSPKRKAQPPPAKSLQLAVLQGSDPEPAVSRHACILIPLSVKGLSEMGPLGYPVRMTPSPWASGSGKTSFHPSIQSVSERRVCGLNAGTWLEGVRAVSSVLILLGGSVHREMDSDLGTGRIRVYFGLVDYELCWLSFREFAVAHCLLIRKKSRDY